MDMTNRRRAASFSRTLLATAMGACLTAGCGVIPGGSGGSGDTLTVMTFAPIDTKATNMPGMPGMAKAYERWVNANGGIKGHKLRVLTCNEKNTPAGAGECARQAVSEKAIAVVGSYSQHGRSFMAPLEAAGIPFVGGYGVSSEEFQSTLSYPINGGQPALLAGAGHQLGKACSEVSLVRPDTLAGDSMPVLLNAGLKVNKMADAHDIRAAEDATDFTQQARDALTGTTATGSGSGSGSTASPSSPSSSSTPSPSAGGSTKEAAKDGAKSCVTAVLGERTETFFDAFRRVNSQAPQKDPQISSVLGSVSQALVDRTGGKESPFEGALLTSWYPVSTDPLWAPMRKVVSEQAFGDDSVDPDDSGAQTTWIAYTVLSEILKGMDDGDITGRKVARALGQSSGVKTGGLTPDLSWRYQDMRAISGFPRLVNGRVSFQVVQAGRLITQPGEAPQDMTSVLEQAPRSA